MNIRPCPNIPDHINGYDGQTYKLNNITTAVGIVRPNPQGTSPTAYYYDYYLTDHLGNVRAVLTEENAIDQTLAATMEIENSQDEGSDFEYINYSRSAISIGYPTQENTGLFVSELSAESTVQGPANLSAVGMSDQIQLSVQSWFADENTTTTLQTVSSIFSDIVANIILQGTDVIADENALIALQDNSTTQANMLLGFLENEFDNQDMSIPQGYLVYLFFF